MADNLTFQSATLATIADTTVVATDDVGGVQYQRVKPDMGADGASVVVAVGSGAINTGTQRVVLATDTTVPNVTGNVAHDAADSGNPVKIGAKAIAFGTNPTGVTAGDRTDLYANRAGIPFVIGGHPNARTAVYLTTGAQTDDNVLAAIASGTKYVITRYEVTLDQATTVGVAVRLGFGATTVPALPSSGADAVEGILMYHPGLVPGSGMARGSGSGVLGVGGDGEELRITCGAPTSGTLVVAVTFYTIES